MIKEDYFNLSTMLNLKKPMGVLIKYTQTRVYDINNRKHDFAWSRYIQWRQAWVKECGEHLVCFFIIILFFYSKIELTSSSSFLCMELLGFSPSSPTLGLLCKSQVCSVGVSSWVCSIMAFSLMQLWCSLVSYAPCSS